MHRRPRALLGLLLGLALLGLPVLATGSASAAEPCTPGPTCLATRVRVLSAPAKAVYKQTKNAQYHLVYAGGTYTFPDGSGSVDLAPSTSTAHGIHVWRDLHDRGVKQSGNNFLVGNVDPGWGGKAIYLQRKTCTSCAWKGYATQRTTSTGGWKFRVPSPKHGKWYWRTYVPATADYLRSMSGGYVTYTTYF